MSVFGILLLGSMTAGQASGAMLLTSTNEAQLETWLGQGDLDFTNIFTKTTGDGQTSIDFHAAADGKGPTFSLLEVVSVDGVPDFTPVVIGGYNPQSWNSSGSYNITLNDADRTAFIFNLTNLELRRQKLSTDSSGIGGEGVYQTYNASYDGPIFGGGWDLYADYYMSSGYSYTYSYGEGLSWGTANLHGTPGAPRSFYGRIEVYTFAAADAAPSSVPEPSSCLMAGLAGLGLVVRRRSQRTRLGC